MKKLICIFALLLLSMVFCTGVRAEEAETYSEQYDISGASELQEQVPDDAKNFVKENGISASDSGGLLSLSPGKIFDTVISMVKNKLTSPLKMFTALMGVILLCSLLEGMKSTVGEEQLTQTFNIVGILTAATMVAIPITGCISEASAALRAGGNFMLSFVPVFSSVTAVTGNITSAAVYHTLLLAVAEFSVQLASGMLMPMLGCFLALSIIAAVNPDLNLHSFANAIRTVTLWALGLIMTVFVGLLTIQGFVGTAADTVTIRAAKFAIASFVPIVGGALSDALTTVQGSLGVLKAGIGGFGIAVGVMTMLPTILSVLLLKLSIDLAAFAGEIFGVGRITVLLKSAASTLTIILALLLCFCLMLVISTTIIMMMGLGQ